MLRGASGEGATMLREFARNGMDATPWSALLARDAADWALVALLFVVSMSTEGLAPFERYLHTEELWKMSYPLRPNTVPSAAVLPIAFGIPAAVFFALHATRRIDRRDTARLMLGLFFACTTTLFVTNVIKLMVGRPRPNFAARCWPDGVVAGVPGVPVCSGSAAAVREGRKSFPSGHTSLSTAGLAYLSFFLLAAARPRAGADVGGVWRSDAGAAWRAAAALSPLLFATWIGLTRVRDYWHNWDDVATGAALGGAIAYTCLRKVAAPRVLCLPAAAPGGEPAPAAGAAALPDDSAGEP